MELIRNPRTDDPQSAHADPSTADLFALLWGALADVLGTASAAVILRRAAQRAVNECPELRELTISRLDLEYRYSVPRAWENRAECSPSLRTLVAELLPLLVELTGRVAIVQLEKIPELRASGLISEQEEQP